MKETDDIITKFKALVNVARIDPEVALDSLDLTRDERDRVKQAVKELFESVDTNVVRVEVRKKAFKRMANNQIIGLDDEYEKIRDFLEDEKKKFLAVVGKEYSGKTLIIDKVMHDLEYYYEDVYDHVAFFTTKAYNNRHQFKMSFLFDNIDSAKELGITKGKYRRSVTKRRSRIRELLEKHESSNKIVFTMKTLDTELEHLFDVVVRVKNPSFDMVYDFIKKNNPSLINESETELEHRYNECECSVFRFYEYLESGVVRADRKIDQTAECARLTDVIFTSADRHDVYSRLCSIMEKEHVPKSHEGKKIVYYGSVNHQTYLESYLMENVFTYLEPGDVFYHDVMILQKIHENKNTINSSTISRLLAYGFKISTKRSKTVIPFVETKYARRR